MRINEAEDTHTHTVYSYGKRKWCVDVQSHSCAFVRSSINPFTPGRHSYFQIYRWVTEIKYITKNNKNITWLPKRVGHLKIDIFKLHPWVERGYNLCQTLGTRNKKLTEDLSCKKKKKLAGDWLLSHLATAYVYQGLLVRSLCSSSKVFNSTNITCPEMTLLLSCYFS